MRIQKSPTQWGLRPSFWSHTHQEACWGHSSLGPEESKHAEEMKCAVTGLSHLLPYLEVHFRWPCPLS